MPYGTFPNLKVAVNDFVFNKIINDSFETQAPKTINLSRWFASFLEANGFHRHGAEEEAERQQVLLIRRLSEILDEYQALGIGAPLDFSRNENVLLTWRHPRSSTIADRDLVSIEYIEILDWLSQLDARQYLLAGILFLKILRCDPIFVTDGPNDGGVDCIGRMVEGPLRSTLIFVQVKTRQGRHVQVGRDILLQEYGKYMSLSKTNKYRDYLDALGFEKIRDGCGSVFVMVSNIEFVFGSQILGKNLGILLRSGRQMAHFIADYLDLPRLVELNRQISIPSRPDLTTNFAPLLEPFMASDESTGE